MSRETPSFNDVTAHYRDVVGTPTQKADLSTLPAPLRWFGIFVFAAMGVGVVLFVISYVISRFF
ncbi:hypothetical protein [Paenibacillus curdlanolyticus]|uniref:hypothetical protein n=1 Tax=Paenibacillus curdlanolyticus TaxID=59840 RepID=UPI000A018E3F|nr:hypothetical protein [Paenibacillus curdlanolyticus]